jgi:hypothetical protein
VKHLLIAGPRAGHEISFQGPILRVPNHSHCSYDYHRAPWEDHCHVSTYRSETLHIGTATFRIGIPVEISSETAIAMLLATYARTARP